MIKVLQETSFHFSSSFCLPFLLFYLLSHHTDWIFLLLSCTHKYQWFWKVKRRKFEIEGQTWKQISEINNLSILKQNVQWSIQKKRMPHPVLSLIFQRQTVDSRQMNNAQQLTCSGKVPKNSQSFSCFPLLTHAEYSHKFSFKVLAIKES